MTKRWRTTSTVLVLAGLLSTALASDTPPRQVSKAANAWQAWTELTRSSITFEPIEFEISPEAGVVSFGGEKEGGDALITRIMGPSSEDFSRILGAMRADKRKEFYVEFLNGLSKGRYPIKTEPVRLSGEKVKLPTLPAEKQYGRLDIRELEAEFNRWLSQTDDRPFAFIKQEVREAIFDGAFPGMGNKDWIDRAMAAYPRLFDAARSSDPVPIHFNKWKPMYGDPEKYISRMVTELLGDWELNFRPQKSFGETEGMIHWFKTAMDNEDRMYRNFGHKWTVLPKRSGATAHVTAMMENKLAEVYKASQALIALRGIEMNSGILTSMYNEIRSDEMLRTHNTERSVMRLKDNLFSSNTGAAAWNIEQRSGTSYNPTRRLVQRAIVSRYATDDWEGIADSKSYTLIPNETHDSIKDLVSRFDVTQYEARACIARLEAITFDGDEELVQGLRRSSLAPFWNWEQAPFVSPSKHEVLKSVTKKFIQQVAALPVGPSSNEKVIEELAKWSAIADLDTDIEVYLTPKPKLSKVSGIKGPGFGKIVRKAPLNVVDVNKLEFGIEYTARFPMRANSVFTEEELKNGRKGFIQLEYDMTPDEKRKVIHDIASKLSERLNGKKVEPKRVDSAGHGHKIAITYEVTTPSGETWRVEWDGIGRDYDLQGNVLTGSERGGVVEVVTPKYNPRAKDVKALYEIFKEEGMHPSFYNGGGHVNFDLAAFEGKPKEFAKFIGLFLENRDVITAMFQHPGRFSTAEPHEVSEEFLNKLKTFDGTEEELKQLLYNERFFNTRLGRKTKYVQLELSSFFQDIIPEEFITKDFDIKNDVWRKQFRVSPNIRKGEFRLFGAPRTVEEAHLQLALVRSMMDRAINDPAPLTGKLVQVNPEAMVKDGLGSFERFAKTMAELRLNPADFEGLFAEGMLNLQHYTDSSFYEPYDVKMQDFPKTKGWKTAVKARTAAEALASRGREWNSALSEEEAVQLKKLKDSVKRQTARQRETYGKKRNGELLAQTWREYDDSTVANLKRLSWDKLKKYPEVAIEFVYERDFKTGKYEQAMKRIRELQESQDGLDSKIEKMIKDPRTGLDTDRLTFYLLSMQDGQKAGDLAGAIFKSGDPKAVDKFLDLLSITGNKFRSQFISSIEFRRALYSVPGRGFETAWGDALARVRELAGKDPKDFKQLIEFGLIPLLSKNDVSASKKELALLKKIAAEVEERKGLRAMLYWGPEDNSRDYLKRLLKRRCTELLLSAH